MDDEEDEISTKDSSDEYDQEQLEIALYSQIHFEQDDESQHVKNENDVNNIEDHAVDNDFIISVEGNEKKGFVAIESNADIILNNDLEKKYRNENILNDNKKREEGVNLEKTASRESETTNFRGRSSLKQGNKKSFDKFTSSGNGTEKSTKMQTLLDKKFERGGKALTAEELFLGTNSEDDNEFDDDYDDDVICLSDTCDIVLSGSEADSLDIVLGEPEERIDDIQMNVRSEPRYTYRKMSNEDALPDMEKHSNDGSNWSICREDSYRELMSAKSRHGRYYKPIKCHNCDKEGHLSKNCPQPKKVIVCIMCAEPGHISRTCPQAMCFNCNEPGHDSKSCFAPRRSFNYTCYRCNMKGHDQSRCPDNWRQFHVTVTSGKIQQLAVQTKRKTPSCFNCGEEGHLGHECEEDRMNRFTSVYTPFICRYQTMKEFSYKMRRTDEAEEQPLKRSRSDGWISNLVNSKSKFKPNCHITFEEDKANMIDVPVRSDNFMEGKKKTSQFAHIVRKHPENWTGRNNFDNMQFTLLNSGKDGMSKKTEVTKGIKNDRSRRKKKGSEKESAEEDFKKMGNKDKNMTGYKRRKACFEEKSKREKDFSRSDKVKMMSNEKDRRKNYSNNNIQALFRKTENGNTFKDKKNFGDFNDFKANGKQLNHDKGSNVRKVTLNSSNCDFTISSKSNFNEKFDSGETNNSDLSTNGGYQNSNFGRVGQKRRKGSELEKVVIDLTIGNDTESRTCKEKKWEENQGKFSNLRNDSLRSDDLFSLQKIAKLQSSGQFDMPNELEADIDHQVHNNEWWKKRNQNSQKRKRKRNRKKNKINLCDN